MDISSATPVSEKTEAEIYLSLVKKAVLGSGTICIVGIGAYACLFLLMQWI